MTDELTFPHTHEACRRGPDGKHYCVATYDARITLDVWDDGTFAVANIELAGVRYEPVTSRHERWFEIGPTDPLYPAIFEEAVKRAPGEIDDALTRGEIGPAAAREARLLEAGKERAKSLMGAE